MTTIVSTPQHDTTKFERFLVLTLLVLGLVISSITGVLIAYIALALTIVSGIVLASRDNREVWTIDTMGLVFLGAFLLLALSFAVSATDATDLSFALNFLTFLLYIPMACLLTRSASQNASRLVAWLALSGAVIGAVYAVGEVVVTGATRAGWLMPQNDPIRVANTALILGFLALIGLRQQTGNVRYLLLTGPFFGLAAVIACGSRTAMVAFALMLFWAAFNLIKGWKGRLLIAVAIAGALFAVITTGALQSDRVNSLIVSLQQILTGQAITDVSMDIRMSLYRGSIQAFWSAPIFGHGWSGMMQAIAPFLPEQYADQVSLPHLHNEFLNFAVAAGLVGVVVLLALLAAPIIIALRSPPDSQKQARVFGCSLLLLGYLAMGLADTMVSYETHTALYVIWSAILLSYCRDTPAKAMSA